MPRSSSGGDRDRDPLDDSHPDHGTLLALGGGGGGRDLATQLRQLQQHYGSGGAAAAAANHPSVAAALAAAAGLGGRGGGSSMSAGSAGGFGSSSSAAAAYYAAAAAAAGGGGGGSAASSGTNQYLQQLAAAQQLQQQAALLGVTSAAASRRSLAASSIFQDAAAASYLNNPYTAAAAAGLSAELYAQELLHRHQQQAVAVAAAREEAAAMAAHYNNPHATAAHELAAHLEGSRAAAAAVAARRTGSGSAGGTTASRPYGIVGSSSSAAMDESRATAVELELEARMMRHRYGLDASSAGAGAAALVAGESLRPTYSGSGNAATAADILSSTGLLAAERFGRLPSHHIVRPFSSTRSSTYDTAAAAAAAMFEARQHGYSSNKQETIDLLHSSDTPSPGSHHYRNVRTSTNQEMSSRGHNDHPFFSKKQKYDDTDSSSLSVDSETHRRYYDSNMGNRSTFGESTKKRKGSSTNNKRSKRDSIQNSSPASKEAWATTFTPLALATDQYWLTELWCFLRSEFIEAFGAVDDDLKLPLNGRTKPSTIGQVGLRCKWCKDKPFNSREQLSLICPSTVSGIYNGAYQMLRMHFDLCQYIPDEIKKKVSLLQSATPRGGRNDYWVMSAKRLGIKETPLGLFYESDPHKCRKKVEEEELAKLSSNDAAIKLKSPQSLSSPDTRTPAPIKSGATGQKFTGEEGVDTPGSVENLPLAPNTETQQPVVYPKDANLVSKLLFVAFDNLHLTKLTEADKIGCYRMRQTGYPGVACNHCVGISGNGRYFPPTEQSLSQTTTTQTIVNHLKSCVRCPEETRILLKQLLTIDPKKLPKDQKPIHGGRKVFFRRVWCRIQGKEEPGSDNEVYHEKKKVQTHLRKQVAESILEEQRQKEAKAAAAALSAAEARAAATALSSAAALTAMPPPPPVEGSKTNEKELVDGIDVPALKEVDVDSSDKPSADDNKVPHEQINEETSTSTDGGYHSDVDEDQEKVSSSSSPPGIKEMPPPLPVRPQPTSEFSRMDALLKASRTTPDNDNKEALPGIKESLVESQDDDSSTETTSSAVTDVMDDRSSNKNLQQQQQQDESELFFHGWTKLSTSDDTSFLSDLVSFCRSDCFEAFTVPNWLHAEDLDDAGGPFRQNTLIPGQVGIRCVDCAKKLASKDRPDSHVAYPTCLEDIQGIVNDLIKRHLSKCPSMSKDKELTLKALRGYGYKKASQEQVNQFWVDGLIELGMEERPSDAPNAAEDKLPGTVRFVRNPFLPSPASLLLSTPYDIDEDNHLLSIPVVRKNFIRAKKEAEENLKLSEWIQTNDSNNAGDPTQQADTRSSLLANEHTAPAPFEAPMEDKHEAPIVTNRDPEGFIVSSWVKSEDRSLTTDFLYFLLYCTQPCKTKRIKDKSEKIIDQTLKNSEGPALTQQEDGSQTPLVCLECRWCSPAQRNESRKRYKIAEAAGGKKIIYSDKSKNNCEGSQFQSSIKAFGETTMANVQQHMLVNCVFCPKPVRASLKFLLHRHSTQMNREKRMKGSKKKVFYDTLLERLQLARKSNAKEQLPCKDQKPTATPTELPRSGEPGPISPPQLPTVSTTAEAASKNAGKKVNESPDLLTRILVDLVDLDTHSADAGRDRNRSPLKKKKKKKISTATTSMTSKGDLNDLYKKKRKKSEVRSDREKKKKKKKKKRSEMEGQPSGTLSFIMPMETQSSNVQYSNFSNNNVEQSQTGKDPNDLVAV